jgi:hypothetical protein
MVYTALRFEEPDGTSPAYQRFSSRDGWVTVEEVIDSRIGGSGAMAWRRSFWEQAGADPGALRYGRVHAAARGTLGGFWFHQRTAACVCEARAIRTTLGSKACCARLPESEHPPVIEHMHFQIGGCYYAALERMTELEVGAEAEDREAMLHGLGPVRLRG